MKIFRIQFKLWIRFTGNWGRFSKSYRYRGFVDRVSKPAEFFRNYARECKQNDITQLKFLYTALRINQTSTKLRHTISNYRLKCNVISIQRIKHKWITGHVKRWCGDLGRHCITFSHTSVLATMLHWRASEWHVFV